MNVTCSTGVYDCEYEAIPASEISFCAEYNGEYRDMQGVQWPVVVSAIVMCIMAFGMGSNDAANSWGTSVGSGAIKLRTALILGAICEFCGTVLLGSGVAKTIKKDISDIENENCWACGYCDSKMPLFQAGMLASLLSTAVFLLISSVSSMPVSATHAVVGAVAGMTMGAVGSTCVNWSLSGLGSVVLSWVASPVLAGMISMVIFILTKRNILEGSNPRERILHSIPFFFFLIVIVMVYLICIKSDDLKNLDITIQMSLTAAAGVVALGLSYMLLLPWIRQNMPTARRNLFDTIQSTSDSEDAIVMTSIGQQQSTQSTEMSSLAKSLPNSSDVDDSEEINNNLKSVFDEYDDVMFCFRVLLVFNASLKSFAHGANDTANATGPFVAVLEINDYGLDICSDNNRSPDWWVMVIAGLFVALGILLLGGRVIETIGEKLTAIDYHSGFCVELGSVISVLVATVLGIPVSTTHCQIGAVVGTGFLHAKSEKEKVHWDLFGKIALTWIITLPFSGLLSVGLTEAFRSVYD